MKDCTKGNKHIVFVVGNYKNGGVPMRATNLANEFARRGYNLTILVTKEMADNVFFEHHPNVEIVLLNDYVTEHKDDLSVLKNYQKRAKKIRTLKRLRYFTKFLPEKDKKLAFQIKLLRQGEKMSCYIANNPDSLYIPFGIAYFVQTFGATNSTDSKILYAERNAPELDFPENAQEKAYLFDMLSRAAGAVLQTGDEFSFFGGCLKNAVVINNPVKSNLPEPYQGDRRKVVVNFCRVSEQKNLPLMIAAFLEMHKKHPEYILEIYGNTVEKNEEELKVQISDLITSLDADEYIHLLPPCADVHIKVRDCAMFVSSSDFEGLSNSMVEAMAIGLPCICTDCLGGGARELITDGENGLLVPMKDIKSLADAMVKMAEDEKLSKKCSANAAKIRGKLAVEVIAGKWLEVIENII